MIKNDSGNDKANACDTDSYDDRCNGGDNEHDKDTQHVDNTDNVHNINGIDPGNGNDQDEHKQ